MTGLQTVNYASAWNGVQANLKQIRSCVNAIVAAMTALQQQGTAMQASVTAGDGQFTADDVAQITALTSPWTTALPAGSTFQLAAQQFLQTNLGM